MKHLPQTDMDYRSFLADLKVRIRSAQLRTSRAVNAELITLYWEIGRDILAKQAHAGWGAKIIDQLSVDLMREFPDMKGFSPRNLKYMRAFAEAYPDAQFVQQVVAQIPWGHNVRILDYVKSTNERLWYAQKAAEYGWSRNVLVHQIETKLFERQGKALNNFPTALPALQSDLAAQMLKDPYVFEFLYVGNQPKERAIEQGLLRHLRDFLLELGTGFAFVGSQYRLDVGGDEFFVDLLFYHLHLRCYVVIDLKTGDFKPEYAGKMNFYLAVIDDQLRHADDQPSIGLILCKSKNGLVAEYSLKDLHKPVGVSTYRLTEELPEALKAMLPTVAELELSLSDEMMGEEIVED